MKHKTWHDWAIQLKNEGLSSRKIGKELGLGKSTINDFFVKLRAERENTVEQKHTQTKKHTNKPRVKTAVLDLETSPTLALVFRRWDANVNVDGIVEEPYILTYASLWRDNPDCVLSGRATNHSDEKIVNELWHILDEADIVVAHNASRFDIGWMNMRFCYYGLPLPSPYKVIDTLKSIKRAFSLPSNGLDAACHFFGLHRKVSHSGMEMWKRCMIDDDEQAFADMLKYNIQDIYILLELLEKVENYSHNIPNMSLYENNLDVPLCTHCGGKHVVMSDKLYYTNTSAYELVYCEGCKRYSRFKKAIKRSSLAKFVY